MQKFAQFEAMVSNAVDDLYGETVRVEPRVDGQFVRQGSDGTRPAFDITGAVVDIQPAVARLRNAGRNDGDTAEIAADLCHISITDGHLYLVPRRGDRFVLVERIGSPVWQVAKDPEPDGLGRTVFRCTPVKEPAP